jgi:hypothetical protein
VLIEVSKGCGGTGIAWAPPKAANCTAMTSRPPR